MIYHKRLKLCAAIWNKLEFGQRKLLIFRAYPGRSEELAEFESRKKWNDLLPSTQQALAVIGWEW